jgi:hypothetical protein
MRAAAGGLVALAALAAGCAAIPDERARPFPINFRLPDEALRNEPLGAIVFFVDGVNATIFDEMLRDGRLPNLQKHLVARGFYTARCTAGVPSVTLANETSFVTGLFPGHHGITGNNWFDRNLVFWRNYEEIRQKNTLDDDYRAATIYERLPDATTFSLFFQPHRGATKFAENRISAGPPFFFGLYELVDRIALWRFDLVTEAARLQGEWPALVIAYQLAPDMEGYRHGVSSDAYRDAIQHADAHIGRILRGIEAAGFLDRLVLAFISDHGLTEVRRHQPMADFLRKKIGLAVRGETEVTHADFMERLRFYQDCSCVYYGGGDRYFALCLRKPKAGAGGAGDADAAFENWLARPSPEDLHAFPTRDGRRVDLIRTFRDEESVDALAYSAGPGRVRVATKRGTVELERPGERGTAIAYRAVEGADPLGYAAKVPPEMLAGRPFDAQAWLRATADTDYPDLVPQIVAYFEARRAGDIVLFAAPGWDFGRSLKAGHGGLGPEEMFVPLAMAGPGVPRGQPAAGPVRAVDVAPTLLALLGRPVPTDLDGRSLVPAWRRP